MLAKRTSKNQVTLPKAIVQCIGEADDYDGTVEGGRIVLRPASALRFSRSRFAWLREAWQCGRCVPLASRDTVSERLRVRTEQPRSLNGFLHSQLSRHLLDHGVNDGAQAARLARHGWAELGPGLQPSRGVVVELPVQRLSRGHDAIALLREQTGIDRVAAAPDGALRTVFAHPVEAFAALPLATGCRNTTAPAANSRRRRWALAARAVRG